MINFFLDPGILRFSCYSWNNKFSLNMLQFLMTGVAVLKVDNLGRRPLLIGGVSGIVCTSSHDSSLSFLVFFLSKLSPSTCIILKKDDENFPFCAC